MTSTKLLDLGTFRIPSDKGVLDYGVQQGVYLFVAEKPCEYPGDRRSRVIYIGETHRRTSPGIRRPFESLADCLADPTGLLDCPALKNGGLSIIFVPYDPSRQLESALLWVFSGGEKASLPWANKHKKVLSRSRGGSASAVLDVERKWPGVDLKQWLCQFD